MKYTSASLRGLFVISLFLVIISVNAQNNAYYVNGPSEVDLSNCSPGFPQGTASITFWVMRQPDITGPAQLNFNNLPAGVSVSISPQTLTFPGWVVGQQVTASFSVPAGIDIPDQVIDLTISDNANQSDVQMILDGTCPVLNKDFTIRGAFFSDHLGTIYPVEGALVEIYRDVQYGSDEEVGSTRTAADGSFEMKFFSNNEHTFYAKLRLNDVQGVYLHDWWTPEIKDYNSAIRGSNSNPLIDLGGTLIIRDNGTTTPKTAIWQGGRAAFQEFIQINGTPPPTGDYEIVNQNTISNMVWTARSTTNWEDGHRTFKWSDGIPTGPLDPGFDPYFTQFETYNTNFHEFGHALRQTVDGDQAHFLSDATRWTYARGHSLCGSNSGYVDIEAFAFNEGWAEYWSGDDRNDVLSECAGFNLLDMTKEGAVMADLGTLAQLLVGCLPISSSSHADIVMQERKAMFSVVNRGQNIMHSDGEFRSNYLQQFPGCIAPPPGVGVSVQASSVRVPSVEIVNASRFYRAMEVMIRNQQRITETLQSQAILAGKIAARYRENKARICDTCLMRLLAPIRLNAQVRYSEMITDVFRKRVALSKDSAASAIYSEKKYRTDGTRSETV